MRSKNIILLVVFTMLLSFVLNVNAQGQSQMNLQAGMEFQKADKQLNVVYQKILKEYAMQPAFIKNLKLAQRLWVQLRDAELAAKYPEPGTYGSVEPMCKAGYLSALTKERIKFLKVWLEGIEEGDVCTGSVKMK